MSQSHTAESHVVDTALGKVEYADAGSGRPVLFLHGSPGGSDQGALMGAFLVPLGFRVVAPSRPGYLGTPLSDANATPEQQAGLMLALMDKLGLQRFGLLAWSGGGPAAYRLAALHPDRVGALVTLAAVSGPYRFASGIASLEYSLLTGGVGQWLMKEMVEHMPRQVVEMSASEESNLTKAQAKELSEQIWNDPVKRDFVLGLSATVSGRKAGLANDQAQFPAIGDLGLASIRVPTLLVHGTADTDVPPEHSEHAAALIPGAELVRVPLGTHICAFTDPTADAIQARIGEFLRRSA
jgi:pimeloyl-ACP methyl ester carboxylesterase